MNSKKLFISFIEIIITLVEYINEMNAVFISFGWRSF